MGGITFDKQLSFKGNPTDKQLPLPVKAKITDSPKTTAVDSPRKKESIPLDLATEISSMDGNRRLSLRTVLKNPFKSKQYITADLAKQIGNAALAEVNVELMCMLPPSVLICSNVITLNFRL